MFLSSFTLAPGSEAPTLGTGDTPDPDVLQTCPLQALSLSHLHVHRGDRILSFPHLAVCDSDNVEVHLEWEGASTMVCGEAWGLAACEQKGTGPRCRLLIRGGEWMLWLPLPCPCPRLHRLHSTSFRALLGQEGISGTGLSSPEPGLGQLTPVPPHLLTACTFSQVTPGCAGSPLRLIQDPRAAESEP